MMRNPPGRPQTQAQARPAAVPSRGPAAPAPAATPQRSAIEARTASLRAGLDPRTAARPGTQQRAKAEDIFMVLRQLSELLVKENTALKRYRVEEVKALAERKDRLALLYQNHMAAIHRDPTILAGLDTAKRTQLAQLATRPAELMRDNASMLKANIQTIDTFFQAVNDAVREREEKKSASYSRAGMLNTYMTSRRNLAVSYNKTT